MWSDIKEWMASTFTPLSVIAKELTILRELYELDLASRPKPVYRVTEEPSKGDTEVTFAGDAEMRPKKSALAKALESLMPDDEDEYYDDDMDINPEL